MNGLEYSRQCEVCRQFCYLRPGEGYCNLACHTEGSANIVSLADFRSSTPCTGLAPPLTGRGIEIWQKFRVDLVVAGFDPRAYL